jgi:hypothetical protein
MDSSAPPPLLRLHLLPLPRSTLVLGSDQIQCHPKQLVLVRVPLGVIDVGRLRWFELNWHLRRSG